MATVKIPLKLKISVSADDFEFNDSSGDKAVREYLINKKAFFPVKLTTKLNTYAGKLEFGSNPGEELFTREDVTALDKWFREKVGVQDPAERKERMKAMISRYNSVGHFPRPWFRPAMWSVYDNLQEEFDQYGSFYRLAEEMRDRARDNLDTLGINYTGSLRNSLTVEYLTQDEYRRVMENKIDSKILDEYWNRYRKENEVIPNDDGGQYNDKREERKAQH